MACIYTVYTIHIGYDGFLLQAGTAIRWRFLLKHYLAVAAYVR